MAGCGAGAGRLKAKYVIAPCSNGNIALIVNMAKRAGLPWDVVLGAEPARAYKPVPEAYLASCRMLDLAPAEVLMVAAHNVDLDAARACGLRTAFVPRSTERDLVAGPDVRSCRRRPRRPRHETRLLTMTPREAGIVDSFTPPVGEVSVPDDPEEIIARIFDPQRRGALYPLYHRLRAVAPVHRTEHPAMRGVWFVTRFPDALDLYKNTSAVSDPATAEHFNHGGMGGPFYPLLKEMMLFLESEQHARVRRLVVNAFTPKSIEKVRPITQEYANRSLAALGDRHEMDVVTEFAYELPLRVIAHLLGVPEADFPTIEQYAFDFARGSEPSPVVTDRTRRADDAALGFRDYFEHLIARRRDDLGDDVLSALITAEDEGRSPDARPGDRDERAPHAGRARDHDRLDRQRARRALAEPRPARVASVATPRSPGTRSKSCSATTRPTSSTTGCSSTT